MVCGPPAVPGQQLFVVGVGGKPTNGVNLVPHRNVLVEDAHALGAVDDAPRQSTSRGIADEYHAAKIQRVENIESRT